MSVAREQVMEALQARLAGAAAFGVVTRRLTSPETIAQPGAPALALVKHHESYHRQSPMLPPERTINVLALIYIHVGTDVNAIPDAVLNPIQDAIDAALAPDSAAGRCTLGGLVYSAMISGEVIAAPGDKTGQGVALIPIDIVLP